MLFQPVIPYLAIIIFGAVSLGFIILVAFQASKTSLTRKRTWLLRSSYIILAVLLLLRPALGEYKNVEVYTNQYDIYFVVDTTASMIAEDWEPESKATRLEAVKKDISRLVDTYSGARYGLITFSSDARVTTPLTRDSTALISSVKNLKPEITKYSKGSEVKVAADTLKNVLTENAQASPERARLVFVFSDGENTADKPTGDYSFASSKEYVTSGAVYGYGTEEGGKMEVQQGYFITNDEGYIKDPETGEDALSKIDEAQLNEIATELGIEYIHRSYETPITSPDIEDNVLVDTKMDMSVTVDYTWLIGIGLFLILTLDLAFMIKQLRLVLRKEGGNNG
jgi:Ca-activated chloride channel family protein